MKRTSRIIPIIIALLVPLMVLGLSLVLKNYVDRQRAALDAANVALQAAEQRERYLTELSRSVRDSAELRASLLAHFLDARTTAGFLGDLEAMGRTLGLETKTVSLGIENGTLGVGISLVGRFSAIFRFIELSEQLPYNVLLEHVDLGVAGNGAWRGEIVLRVISFEQ